MLTAIVVLHLAVHDTNTGYEAERVMPSYATSIAACRKTGVEGWPTFKTHQMSADFST